MKSKNQMFAALLLTVFSLFTQMESIAQNNQPVYALVTQIKVDRNKSAQYEELVKTYGAKVFKDRIERGEITAYTLYSVGMSTDNSDDYNYVSVATGNNVSTLMEPAISPIEIMKKTMPGVTQQMLDEVGPKYAVVRELKNNMLLRWVEGVPQVNGTERKFFQIRFVKAKPGREAEYVKMLKDVTKPVIEGRTSGGEVNGWSVSETVFPTSEGSSFNMVSALSFSSWEKLTASNYNSSFLKAFPKGDPAKSQAQFRDVRTVTREEVWKQVLRVDNTTK